MIRKLCIPALLTLLLLAAMTANAARWIPLNGAQAQPEAPVLELQRCDFNTIHLVFSVSGFEQEILELDQGTFNRLILGEEGYTTDVGRPQLPVLRRFIEIPYGAEVSVSADPHVMMRTTLPELGMSGCLVPAQAPVEKIPGALESAPFAYDENAYRQANLQIGELVRIKEGGIMRGHRFVMLEVYPIDYNPATGELRIISSMDVQITLTGSDVGLTQAKKARYGSPYYNALAGRIFLNGGVYDELDLVSVPMGLLIITNQSYAATQSVQDFIAWKEQKGFHTTVATTEVIGGSLNQIKNYIQIAYDTWTIPPDFVILIGDVNVIPEWTGSGSGSPHTDLYYATLEGGDAFNDVGIGRFSPSNTSNLNNMIRKTLEYEQVGWSGNDDWEKYAVFMASNDNYTVSEGTHNFVINNYLQPDGYRFSKLYCHTYGAYSQQITDNINAGRSLAIYSGHGDVTYWADGPVYYASDVNALVNTVYPFVASHSCLTGQFQSDCFGETWIRATHGALAFWGSSVTSYWSEDDILEKRMFEGFFDVQWPQEPQNLTWLAGMTDYGKYETWMYFGGGSMMLRYYEMYNILGDPTVDLWTDVPQLLTVNHPSAVLIGQNSIMVTVSGYPDWALVNIYSDSEDLMFTGYVNNGSITFNLGSGFTQPGTLHVWVTGHDCHPYHGTASIIPPSGPYVVYSSHVVDDSNLGNNNGQLDYSETVELSIYVQNVGVETAHGVTLTITSLDPLLTVIDGAEYLGDVPAGGIVGTTNGFTVQSGSALPDNYSLNCQLTATAGSNNWNSNFTILGHAPKAEYDSLIVHDETGNMNGCLDPGETANMEIIVRNNGSGFVPNLAFTAECLDPNITLNTSAATVGNLAPGQAGSGTISVTVSPSCPYEYEVSFRLYFTGDGGYSAQDMFSTVVGNLLYAPTGPDGYGYMAFDNYDGQEAPVFNWIEIVPSPGTTIPFTADDQTFQFDLPFNFMYYGQNFNRISVCGNGWVAMGNTTNTDYSNSGIPDGDGPPNMIAPFWEDLSPQSVGTVAYYYDATNHWYVVEFSGVRQYAPSSAIETFEVILYDPAYYPAPTGDGQILFQYLQVSDPTECTVGIENGDQTIGIQYLLNAAYEQHAKPVEPGTAILYKTVDPSSDLTITLTPESLPIVIPPTGGSFNYTIAVANTGFIQTTADIWCNIILPNGRPYGPTLGPVVDFIFPMLWSTSRNRTQVIPAGGPAGNYTYNGYIGEYPGTIYTQDSFPFSKSGDDGSGNWYEGWENYGEPFVEDTQIGAAVIPEQYALHQAFPNPFNPSTTIRFELPEAALVKLTIFDLQGRVAGLLVNGYRAAGVHEVTFEANELASGIYFYRLEAGDFSAVQKVMLLK
ncbi:MAG: C25 family cysteine peptidase [bacterium]